MVSSPELHLRYYGDPILRQKAVPVTKIDPDLAAFVKGMFECMYRADGIGLAAPQVGLLHRVFVLDVLPEDAPRLKRAFVNPVIVKREGSVVAEEGCLSIPGIRHDVKRAERVIVEAMDETGAPFRMEAEGLVARAIQHETDHLDGVLFVDRLSAIQRKLLDGKLKRLAEEREIESPGSSPSR